MSELMAEESFLLCFLFCFSLYVDVVLMSQILDTVEMFSSLSLI